MYDKIISELQEAGVMLSRPLVFFDLETTGLDVRTDRIVEISAIKINPDYSVDDFYYRLNPQMHIPQAATDVHGITDEDVKDCPFFANISEALFNFLNDCDLGGYNISRYDIPLLIEEFQRVGKPFKYSGRSIVDGLAVYRKMEPRDLTHTYEYYTGDILEDAHSAQADNVAAARVAIAQMKKYGLTSTTEMHKCGNGEIIDLGGFFGRDSEGVIIFLNGKHRGESVVEVAESDKGYIGWMRKECSTDTKRHLEAIISGKER